MRTPLMLPACLAFSVLLMAGPAGAQVVPPETTHVELGWMFWTPTPELTLTFGGSADASIDFVGDLGIEKQRFKEYRLVVKPARKHKIRFSRNPIEYEATGHVLTRAITANGLRFAANQPLHTSVTWDLYRFGYEWDLIARKKGFLGVIADVKYNKISATIDGPAGSAATEAKAPVPTVGGIGRGYLGDYLSITAEFTGIRLTRKDYRGKFYDLDLYTQINLIKSLAAQIGYRSVTVDYLVDGDTGAMTLKGPYFGGVVRF